MKDKLLNWISRFGPLSVAEKEDFLSIMKEEHVRKKSHVLKPGQIAEWFYFIVRGGFRSYFIRDGEEITDYFFFEDAFATDYVSMYSGQSSLFYLEAIEDTLAVRYCRRDLLRLAKAHPVFQSFARIHAERAFLEIEERMRLLQNESLKSKYAYTLRKFPELFQRVPQHQIASYLGVKPESLSRVRKNFATKSASLPDP